MNGAYDSESGIAKLASVLDDRMKANGETPAMIDFGIINQDYSLRTNRFQANIPQDDYTVCRHLCELEVEIDDQESKTVSISGGAHGGHESGNGSHSHTADVGHVHKYKTRYLKPGDRVLVVWIQNEVCVVDLIVPATKLRKAGEEL